MAAKLIRLHSSEADSLVGWCETRLYPQDILQLADPNAGFAAKEVTCIPSPYAHLHIVKQAFAYVARHRELKGNTHWHKLVSHCLDIGQILFNLTHYASLFELITWEQSVALTQMKQSTNWAHQEMVAVFDQYMRLEAKFGLAAMEHLYLLKYIGEGRKSAMDIVGGISPLTLFYTSPDELSYLSSFIDLGTHAAFAQTPTCLVERDEEFQKYLLQWKWSSTRFQKLFPELDEYLKLVIFEKGIQDEVAAYIGDSPMCWEPLISEEGWPVTSWGKKLLTRKRTG